MVTVATGVPELFVITAMLAREPVTVTVTPPAGVGPDRPTLPRVNTFEGSVWFGLTYWRVSCAQNAKGGRDKEMPAATPLGGSTTKRVVEVVPL